MITVIGQCVEAGNETGARQLFDVLETLLILVCIMLSERLPRDLFIYFSRKSLFSAITFLNWRISFYNAEGIGRSRMNFAS